MASSIIAAVMAKWDALDAANFPSGSRPAIYLDEAVQADGTQVRPPYAILRDKGLVPEQLGFERQTLEVNEFELEIYYASLADCDTAAEAVKLDGGTRAQGNGFDFGTVTLAPPRSSFQILRTRETRRFAGLNLSNVRTYVVTLEYKVTPLDAS